jgi:pyruvate/oxaloacetate carboxyltransferase
VLATRQLKAWSQALQGTEYDTGLSLVALQEVTAYFREVRRKYWQFESEFTGVDTRVLVNQVPGGMISNLSNQLKEQGALNRMDEVLAEIPRVREDLGFPPLVTPTSQIVGTQAVLNVMTGARYKSVTNEVKNYFWGNMVKHQHQLMLILEILPSDTMQKSSNVALLTCLRMKWISCTKSLKLGR